jgi:hypothetical protein
MERAPNLTQAGTRVSLDILDDFQLHFLTPLVDVPRAEHRHGVRVNLATTAGIRKGIAIEEVVLVSSVIDDFVFVHFLFSFPFVSLL